MLSVIESRRYAFKHNLGAVLMSGVAVSRRRCVLFYSNKRYFDYDPYSKQVLHEGILPEKPFTTILLNKSQIICLLDTGRLIILNIDKATIFSVCQLPLVKTQDQFTDKQVLFNSQLGVFSESNSYYIQLPYKEQNKRRVMYFPNANSTQFVTFEFHSIEPVCEKLDEFSKLIIYYQHIQQDVEWDIKIIDLIEGIDRRIVIDNPLLKPGTIVSKIIMKCEAQLYLFVNSPYPQILIFELESQDMLQIHFKLKPNFIDVIFYDQPRQLICLSFLQHTKINGQITDNILELVDLNTQKTISASNVSLKSISVPMEKDYILDLAAEGKPGNSTLFHSRHLIRKKAMMFHLMFKFGTFNRFGSNVGRYVLALFQL